MRSQYGLSLYGSEFDSMSWAEFRSLLSGLGPDTALGRIVQIRSEDDPDMIKAMTPGQRKIRSEWRQKMAKEKSDSELKEFLDGMKQLFTAMAE